jgi:hypothetical protein
MTPVLTPALVLSLALCAAATPPDPDLSMSAATAHSPTRMLTEQGRLELLRSHTALPEGPYLRVLQALQESGAASIGYAISPRGRAMGLVGTGSGEAFTRAVSGLLLELTDERTAATFRTLATFQDHQNLRLELVLGSPSWLRAGVRGVGASRVRVVLKEESVPESERQRLLAAPGLGSQVEGLDVYTDGQHPSTFAVVHSLPAAPADSPDIDALLGADSVQITRLAGHPHRTDVRRTGGLQDRALIEWLVGHGGGDTEAAKRLGPVHGSLDAQGPDEIAWMEGQLVDSLVFLYRAPSGISEIRK